MSFRQQSGRAGRRDTPALVIMVASQNPLDRYIADHPQLLIDGKPEDAAIDIANPRIAHGQLGCAAREQPLGPEDRALYGSGYDERVRQLVAQRKLTLLDTTFVSTNSTSRPADVSLRSIEGAPYKLMVGRNHLGEMDARYVAREDTQERSISTMVRHTA